MFFIYKNTTCIFLLFILHFRAQSTQSWMTATLTGPVPTPRSSSPMTPCLPRASGSLWRMWWTRAVPGAFPERKMDISSLLLAQDWVEQGLLCREEVWGVLELAVLLGWAKGVILGHRKNHFGFLQQKRNQQNPQHNLVSLFPAEIRSVSKQKELNELQLPLGVLQEVPLSFVKLITAVSWTILKVFFVVKKLCCHI